MLQVRVCKARKKPTRRSPGWAGKLCVRAIFWKEDLTDVHLLAQPLWVKGICMYPASNRLLVVLHGDLASEAAAAPADMQVLTGPSKSMIERMKSHSLSHNALLLGLAAAGMLPSQS